MAYCTKMRLIVATLLGFGVVTSWAAAEGPKFAHEKVLLALDDVGNFPDIAPAANGRARCKKTECRALIRNQLVALFTQQTNEAMSTVEGKEKLRQEALKQTQQVMNDETGKPVVEDLLFNNLIIQ